MTTAVERNQHAKNDPKKESAPIRKKIHTGFLKYLSCKKVRDKLIINTKRKIEKKMMRKKCDT